MISYLRGPLSVTWFLLIAATFVAWWVGTGADRASGASFFITSSVVMIALLKTRMVFSYFMGVRAGPLWLRTTLDGWLAGVAFIFLALYEYRLHAEHFR